MQNVLPCVGGTSSQRGDERGVSRGRRQVVEAPAHARSAQVGRGRFWRNGVEVSGLVLQADQSRVGGVGATQAANHKISRGHRIQHRQRNRIRSCRAADRAIALNMHKIDRLNGIGGRGHRAVVQTTGSRHRVDGGGLGHRNGTRIRSRANRRSASVGGVVDGGTRSGIAQGH